MNDRPRILSLGSTSVDARIALAPNRTQWEEMDDPRSSVSEGNAAVWTMIRDEIDALYHPQAKMLGSGSLVREDAPLRELPPVEGDIRSLYQDFLPEEVVKNPGHTTWLVVVDSRGRLRSGYKGTETPGHHMLHLVSWTTPPETLAFLQVQRIPYLVSGEDRVDLREAMTKMTAKLGVTCLVSEAVGRLNGALLREGLIDEVDLILRPELIGGETTPMLFQSPNLSPDAWPDRLRLLEVRPLESGFVWLRYEVLQSGSAREDLRPD